MTTHPPLAPTWVDFVYRDFYDVPRAIVFAHPSGRLLLLDSPFDSTVDDYPSVYRVYELPLDIPLSGFWQGLADRAIAALGAVPIDAVLFDPSRRARLDASTVHAFIDSPTEATGPAPNEPRNPR